MMDRGVLEALVKVLEKLVDQLARKELPAPKPAPQAPAPPDHAPHFTMDMTMCCHAHEAQFERHARRGQASLDVSELRLPWLAPRELPAEVEARSWFHRTFGPWQPWRRRR